MANRAPVPTNGLQHQSQTAKATLYWEGPYPAFATFY